jgi:hypothetical protein
MSSSIAPDRKLFQLRRPVILMMIALLLSQAANAYAFRGSFVTSCDYSHSLPDDPIVFPGQPGASHLHDFFGSKVTKAGSTLHSMRKGETTCRMLADTAGYWSPTAYLASQRITPDRVRAYYFGIVKGGLETIPAGLQMLAGNKNAVTPDENPHVDWFCGAAKKKAIGTPVSTHPYDCSPYLERDPFDDGIVARLDFPNCWDGVGLAPNDVVYADHTFRRPGACPAGFHHVIPRLILRIHYGVMDPCAGVTPCTWHEPSAANVQLTLSSGTYVTFHADFWNTWHQRRLDHFVTICLDLHRPCGGLVS